MNSLSDNVSELVTNPAIRAVIYLAVAILVITVVRLGVFPMIMRLTRRTRTDFDDSILMALRGPVLATILILGITAACESFTLPTKVHFVALGILSTLTITIWGRALLQVGSIFLEAMSRNREKLQWIQPQTLPLLHIAWKIVIAGGITYFLMLAWRINPTSWLASAGVAGIAIGFAAKDTLANLFAGLFILADAPFKIGDYVVLGSGLRGEIQNIGMRSSRILTRDDIEVTVPNAVIANAQIINETGGPDQKMRVRVKVEVAYGSNIDQVRQVMLGCAEGVSHLVAQPEPRVRFREFGGSGLLFELLAWIEAPVYRGRVLDTLNERVYKAFAEAKIEIPYAKQDVYVKSWPGSFDAPDRS